LNISSIESSASKPSAEDSIGTAADCLPLVKELQPAPEVGALLRRWAAEDYCILLDSASRIQTLGRCSFLAADPFDFVRFPVGTGDALIRLRTLIEAYSSASRPDLPPFQGGAAGVFAYDLNRSLEKIAPPQFDEFQFPSLAIGLYDVVVAWDHLQDRAWIISQGWPERNFEARLQRAQQRLDWAEQLILNAAREPCPLKQHQPVERLAPQFAVEGFGKLTSNFSKSGYLAAVQRAIRYIFDGDIFQVNLSQRLLMPFAANPLETYLQLRAINPAPFAGYFDLGSHQLLSASPERFAQARNGVVETRPIKGTRRRTMYPEADLHEASDLVRSQKDRAENVMIVDLLRNDLSRVCDADSIKVTQLCKLEAYQYVQHLVSAVRGELLADKGAMDLIQAAFPGGSITGAPKVRSMEIIAELEPTARGAYCGCLGYIGFDGSVDLNILIRTMTIAGGFCQIPVGGGIVADSDPLREYVETWDKAAGMLNALRGS